MKRYSIRLDLLTEASPETLEKRVREFVKSRGMEIKYYSSELRHEDRGRPASQREKILQALKKMDKPASIRMLNRKTGVPNITIWRNMKRGVEQGYIEETYNEHLHCKQYLLLPSNLESS